MTTLKIEQLNKYFGQNQVLKDINLAVEERDFVILVGPSGCGKSTLLSLIAGLDQVSSGSILINDQDVTLMPPKDRNIAMVFQSYALYPNMTVYNNIAFGLKMQGLSKAAIVQKVTHVAQILKIEALLERKPAQLSGGQRQRVAMGRAISRDNAMLYLFDEPLSNLDAKLRVEMRYEIKKLHERVNKSIIYVTHDQVEAMTLGEKIAVMKDGIIEQFGSPDEIYNHPNSIFVAGFIGSPAMNFIDVHVERHDNQIGTFFDIDAKKLFLPFPERLINHVGKKITVGIRPENITNTQITAGLEPVEFEVNIDLTEPTGPDTIIFFLINDQTICSRCLPQSNLQKNNRVKLLINLNKLHFFDSETQKIIQ